jgi:hypothetical protein
MGENYFIFLRILAAKTENACQQRRVFYKKLVSHILLDILPDDNWNLEHFQRANENWRDCFGGYY